MMRVAFIGAGQMAHHHLSALERLAVPSDVVGVHDRMTGRAEEFGTLAACRAFPSVEALLADARPDIVHVCTPPGAHFEAASAALEGGAHVYVEKPFALTAGDARTLIDLAQARQRLICAGHQLLRDRAFGRLMARRRRSRDAGAGRQSFRVPACRGIGCAHAAPRRSPGTWSTSCRTRSTRWCRSWSGSLPPRERSSSRGFMPRRRISRPFSAPAMSSGRLSVSLRARPVASSLTLTGTRGSLTCDFVRSIVVGAANPGTEALEKVLNPMIEGVQLLSRTALSLADRVRSSGSYPGLAELIEAVLSGCRHGRALAGLTRAPSPRDRPLRTARCAD